MLTALVNVKLSGLILHNALTAPVNVKFSVRLLPGLKNPVKTGFKYVMKKPIIEMYKPFFLPNIIY